MNEWVQLEVCDQRRINFVHTTAFEAFGNPALAFLGQAEGSAQVEGDGQVARLDMGAQAGGIGPPHPSTTLLGRGRGQRPCDGRDTRDQGLQSVHVARGVLPWLVNRLVGRGPLRCSLHLCCHAHCQHQHQQGTEYRPGLGRHSWLMRC